MLAIFDGRLARRPEYMNKPHKKAVSSLKDDFLVNYFTSLYPDSVVISSQPGSTFAYSLGVTSKSRLPRFHFAHMDNVFCMYQGFIRDFDTVKQYFDTHEVDNESMLMIQAFQILRLLGQRAPKKPVEDASGNSVCAPASERLVEEDLSGNCISILYQSTAKIVIVSGGTYYDLPTYWGIDARFNLVISSNKSVVGKACVSFVQFLSGHVYACCKGQTRQEAIFMNNQPETKPQVDFPDKRTPIPHTVESVTAMILQADMDRSKAIIDYWLPPNPNVLKINTAAIIFKNGGLGIGVLVRNSTGDLLIAVSRRMRNHMPGLCLQSQGLMQGVKLAVGFKYRWCVLESTYLNIETDKGKPGSGKLLSWVKKIAEHVVENLSEFHITFVSDNANKAARGLAEYASVNQLIIWEKQIPRCIAKEIVAERPDSGGKCENRYVSSGFGTNITVDGDRADGPGRCNICHNDFDNLGRIIQHQMDSHKMHADKNQLIPCIKCGRLFTNKHQMIEHRRGVNC